MVGGTYAPPAGHMDVPCVTTKWNSKLFDSDRGGDPPPRCKCFNVHFALGPGPGRPLGSQVLGPCLMFATRATFGLKSQAPYFCFCDLSLAPVSRVRLHGGEVAYCTQPLVSLPSALGLGHRDAGSCNVRVQTSRSRRPFRRPRAVLGPNGRLSPFGDLR